VAAPPGVLREPDLGEDLALAERGGEVVHEELRGAHRAGARGAGDDQLRVQRERRAPRSPAGSAWRASRPACPVAGLVVGHRLGRLGQQRDVLLHQVVAEEVVVGGHRADRDVVAVLADAAQLGDAAEVDEHRRGGEPQPQHRDQALPAGQDLGVVPAVAQRLHRLGDRRRLDVVELGRDHWTSPWGLFGSIEPRPAPGEWVATGVSWVRAPWPPGWPATRAGRWWASRCRHAEVAHGVEHAVDDGRGGGDGAGLADALDPSGFVVAGVLTGRTRSWAGRPPRAGCSRRTCR
jgi:hypothetical protein